ncbi:MAG: transcriptional regulator [Candidatus Sericytochromatia bacterium]|nr:MAG: transcriptional regulator [Candidatus Sericytochromatia bacterium]
MKSCISDCRECVNFKNGVFKNLSNKALKEISKFKVNNFYKKGQTIFHEGRVSFGFYCIKSGKVKLEKIMMFNDRRFIYKIANPTELIGYQSFFMGEKYSETAEALEDTTVCFFNKDLFYYFINEEKNFAFEIFNLMTKNLNYLLNKSRDLACKPVKERFIDLLIELQKLYGVKQADGTIKINISLTRNELSSMLGATTETTVRVISNFVAENIIETRKKKIYIKDLRIIFDNLN